MHEEQLQILANAVVIQAAVDYGYYTKRMQRESRRDSKEIAEREVRRIEEFFTSERFRIFTDVKGPEILERLQDDPLIAHRSSKYYTPRKKTE